MTATLSEDGLLCPSCGRHKLATVDTRPRNGTIRRRRKCVKCKHAFYTIEVPEKAAPAVSIDRDI